MLFNRAPIPLVVIFTAVAGALPPLAHAMPGQQVSAGTVDAQMQILKEKRLSVVRSMVNMTLSILQDRKKSYDDREEVMARGIANMVDTPWIAKFVMGSAWRTATEAQRTYYMELYRNYLIKMYLSNFAQDSERKVSDMKILGILNSEIDNFSVRTEVQLSNAKNLRVDYLVSEKNNERQIHDISIEGVSLLATHRAEFTQIAAAQGVEGVIKTLEKRLQEGAPSLQMAEAL